MIVGRSFTNSTVWSAASGMITLPAPNRPAPITAYTSSTATPRRYTSIWCRRELSRPNTEVGNVAATTSTTGVSV